MILYQFTLCMQENSTCFKMNPSPLSSTKVASPSRVLFLTMIQRALMLSSVWVKTFSIVIVKGSQLFLSISSFCFDHDIACSGAIFCGLDIYISCVQEIFCVLKDEGTCFLISRALYIISFDLLLLVEQIHQRQLVFHISAQYLGPLILVQSLCIL